MPLQKLTARVPGIAILLTVLGLSGPALAGEVVVFAAASLKNAIDEIATEFSGAQGHEVIVSYAASSALARQIQLGAPADLFISANPAWMDVLSDDGGIREQDRFDLIGNRLVMIAREQVSPGSIEDILRREDGRVAMALADAVPAGIYGQEALRSLGLWQDVTPRLVQTDNVRAAMALVASGEVRFGIVYASDAAAGNRVDVVGTFPDDSHSPIVYPAGQLSSSDKVAAAELLQYLRSTSAHSILLRHGFAPLKE